MKHFVLVALFGFAMGHYDPLSKIDPRILKGQSETFSIIVSFKEGTETVLESISKTRFVNREDRLDTLHAGLNQLADKAQKNVRTLLNKWEVEFEPLWITNQVYIKNAKMDVISALEKVSEVKTIDLEEVYPIENIVKEGSQISSKTRTPGDEWAMTKIEAPEARKLLQKHNHSPIILSTIDTGVRHTHEALLDNWIGAYGWYDSCNKSHVPVFDNAHGTHTMGVLAGSKGIGVFPEAKWMTCRGCKQKHCFQGAVLHCSQFLICPTLPDGTRPNCHKAPHVVSVSVSSGQGQPWFDHAILAFHAAHIIPLISLGNTGPKCKTAQSPGDRDVIGVGATNKTDGLTTYSAVGPAVDGRLKPEITAPGEQLLTTEVTSDSSYVASSGTSISTPVAAGVVGILLSYKPDLTYEEVKYFLALGAERKSLVNLGKTCGGLPNDQFPNNHYGHGRVNALQSLSLLIQATEEGKYFK